MPEVLREPSLRELITALLEISIRTDESVRLIGRGIDGELYDVNVLEIYKDTDGIVIDYEDR